MSEHPTAPDGRFVRRTVLISAVLMLLLVAGVYRYVQMRPLLAADAAVDAAFARDYENMQARLDTLSGLDQPQLYYRTVLDCAGMADYHGEQALALELLARPEPADSEAYAAFAQEAKEKTAVYTYHQAMKLYETGEYARAARTAAQVRQYEPAAALHELAQSAYQASLPAPVSTPTAAPVAATAVTPVPTHQPQTEAQDAQLLPEGRLAAGFAHTVVLMEDGTVRAFGDNAHGQLNVEDWRDVTCVAAGAYHTLGLTSDGRVLACGDNTHLQTDVSFYAGVRAIAAGDYASFLLLEGGQVMATGYLDYDFLNELTGAQAIWAGSYGLLVRTADGMLASHPGLALDEKCELAAVSRGYAVGADAQGNTRSTTALAPQWTGVKRLSAGENALLGLRENGEVLSHLFDRHSKVSFAFDQPVLAIAAGPNHYAFLLADGTLECRGADGQVQIHELN